MDSDRKTYLAEAVGGLLLFGGALVWAYNLDPRPIEPNELTGNGERTTSQEGGSEPYNPHQNGSNSSNNQQTLESPPDCDPAPSGSITNPLTCADYKEVPDPKGLNRQCVEKGTYTITNPRTLYGMRTLDSDAYDPIDGDTEIIDTATGQTIGFFVDGVQASFSGMYEQATSDDIACFENKSVLLDQ